MGVTFDFSGQVVLVSGGATGIGAGVVSSFARAGARVFFSYTSNGNGAHTLIGELEAEGHAVAAAPADLGRVEEGERLVSAAESRFGPIDHLVNVAGITDPHPFLELTPEQWNRTLDINLRGMFFLSQRVARSLVARGARHGSIVMTSSVHGKVADPLHAHYEASKGGINMMTRSLAVELGPQGIRVNCVAPGAIEVERYAHMATYDREGWSSHIPLRRVGLPADIAPLCLFLCSSAAAYISGETIYVDGGLTSRMAQL